MKPEAIYQRAIEAFGPDHQMSKAKEECLEFLLATAQYEQSRVRIGAVVEELADVIITTQQARLILGPDLVDAAIKRKLDRLLETIAAVPMTQKKRRN